MSLVSATRNTQLLNCTSAIVLELQEKTIQYSHQSRLQTGELHELRKPMNIHHVLQTCTMITGGGGIPPLPAHAQTVDTRPYLFSSIGLGTRLAQTLKVNQNLLHIRLLNSSLLLALYVHAIVKNKQHSLLCRFFAVLMRFILGDYSYFSPRNDSRSLGKSWYKYLNWWLAMLTELCTSSSYRL